MFKNEGIAETKPRDAGASPSAPAIGPLMNVSQTTLPEEGNRLADAVDTTADPEFAPGNTFSA